MGIEKTNLDNEKINYLLEKNYNIKPQKVTRINRGTSNIFAIKTEQDKYILKEFISKRNKDTIIKEIDIINFLQKQNISVPTYLKTVDGRFFLENKGRILIVQKFVEGYIIENNTGNYKQVMECANVLGKLTKALINYPELSDENIIEENFSKTRVHLGIEKMKELRKSIKKDNVYKEKFEKDIDFRIKILKELESNFNFDIIKNMTMLNSHGDFCSQQLIYSNNKEPVVIDFEKAKKLPIVWEVIRSYTYIDKDVVKGNININTLVDYFIEFTKYIKLNQYDLKYASYIYLIQLASSTYGYKEYNNDYGQKELLEFAFFRTNLCKSLYENCEEISLKLMENLS